MFFCFQFLWFHVRPGHCSISTRQMVTVCWRSKWTFLKRISKTICLYLTIQVWYTQNIFSNKKFNFRYNSSNSPNHHEVPIQCHAWCWILEVQTWLRHNPWFWCTQILQQGNQGVGSILPLLIAGYIMNEDFVGKGIEFKLNNKGNEKE